MQAMSRLQLLRAAAAAAVRPVPLCRAPARHPPRRGINTAGLDAMAQFTPEQQQLHSAMRKWSREQIVPRAKEIDALNDWKAAWPSMWTELGEVGALGVTVPEEYGGLGGSYFDHCIVLEALNYGSGSVGLSVGAHSNLCTNQIRRNGTPEQRAKYLPRLCAGEAVGGLAMSEVQSGSDVLSMKCRASAVEGGFVLNGSKYWCTNGPDADVAVIYARTDVGKGPKGVTAFIVDQTMEGFSRGKPISKFGHRGSNTGELIFEECFVPSDNVLGEVNGGAYVLMSGLDIERVILTAGAIGIMEACLDVTLQYTKEREQFGHPIASFQLMQAKLADMYSKYLVTRTSMYALARAFDTAEARKDGSEKALRRDTAALVLSAGEAAESVALEAVQALGGAGYTTDYPCERFVRDAKLYTIGGGTSEIRRLLIGRELVTESA